jgi:glycosyltransferase involved in cell wall biosynthesis
MLELIEQIPKVSILMVTYNHESFIAQAIESVLMQETNFSYELVIGEDCSTDKTREIVQNFAAKYPEKIRLLLPEKNLGLLGKINFIQTYQACRGEYVAILEGDDYWTDSQKLQKQVEFLDSHPDFSCCFHNAIISDEQNPEKNSNYCLPEQAKVVLLENILLENVIPTCSTMFRNKLINNFPDWYYELLPSDWPLHILHAEKGKIGYINEIMAVRRVHEGGIWSSLNDIKKHDEIIKACHILQKYFKNQYYRYFLKQAEAKSCLANVYTYLVVKNNASSGKYYLNRYFLLKGFDYELICQLMRFTYKKKTTILSFLLQMYIPKMYSLAMKFRKMIKSKYPM